MHPLVLEKGGRGEEEQEDMKKANETKTCWQRM